MLTTSNSPTLTTNLMYGPTMKHTPVITTGLYVEPMVKELFIAGLIGHCALPAVKQLCHRFYSKWWR